MKRYVEKNPSGSRFIVSCSWKAGDGHVFIVENVDGVATFIDPQVKRAGKHVEEYFGRMTFDKGYKAYDLEVMRVDNLDVTELIEKCCEEYL